MKTTSSLPSPGLIIDRDHFIEAVLPTAIEASLPNFDDAASLWICVHDRRSAAVSTLTDSCSPIEPDRAIRNFDFVFTDWKLSSPGRAGRPRTLGSGQFRDECNPFGRFGRSSAWRNRIHRSHGAAGDEAVCHEE